MALITLKTKAKHETASQLISMTLFYIHLDLIGNEITRVSWFNLKRMIEVQYQGIKLKGMLKFFKKLEHGIMNNNSSTDMIKMIIKERPRRLNNEMSDAVDKLVEIYSKY